MCGIFGFAVKNKSDLSKKDLKDAISILSKLSERRGREAAGISAAYGNNIAVYKQPTGASAMLKGRGFKNFIDKLQEPAYLKGAVKAPVMVICHTRLVTNGSQVLSDNNQPIIAGHITGIHNGIVTNAGDLASRHFKSENLTGSDSAVLLRLIDKFYNETGSLKSAVSKAYSEIAGSASVALFSDDCNALMLATNTGSVYYYFDAELGIFVFASEQFIVKEFLRKYHLFSSRASRAVLRLNPGSGAYIRADVIAPDVFQLNPEAYAQAPSAPNVRNSVAYKVFDNGFTRNELRRCTRCVLPATYPFISFDSAGVCNYCRKYKKQEFLGRDALERVLEKHRSKNGAPDCLIGYSGGRDSSYALHLFKTEFGMHPIAYTYDWGLVTDHARRNQARVAGKLGVEHIIRAADIHTKRRHIRKHIYAWLKRPELGMVPLFMAGDKMFYYYGGQLRKETGINLSVFAAGHQLEQMEFKVGFCGIDEHLENNTKLYHFKMMSKIRLASWYLLQYMKNPGYINESFIDSIFAFYCSFINKDDYLYLYRYVPWKEKEIEKTLREEYGWTSDDKYGRNQWRMGDGQTALTNYIYHTVAGFSEFDNFRSNQIREGLITRSEAVRLLKGDNTPRLETLQDFSQLIGFNLEEVLLKINTIPKLYGKQRSNALF